MPEAVKRPGEIRPGDIFEDCRYHPCLCYDTDDDGERIFGISLVDGSTWQCSISHCGVRKLTPAEAWQWKSAGPADVAFEPGEQTATGDRARAAALFARTDRELWLLTAAADGRRGGLIATFVSQASIVPDLPRVVVGLAKQHHTCQLVEASGAFALHLLSEEHLHWVWRFGLNSGRDIDKLAGLPVTTGATGSPILTGSLGWLDCRVEARLDSGDRTVYLAEVVRAELRRDDPPLTARRAIEMAPPVQLRELKDQMARDIGIDEAAIRAWRASHHEQR
jgi:flavin reductase (DIM6/NTAB) family NADH-FMN oxidoreductase RutF